MNGEQRYEEKPRDLEHSRSQVYHAVVLHHPVARGQGQLSASRPQTRCAEDVKRCYSLDNFDRLEDSSDFEEAKNLDYPQDPCLIVQPARTFIRNTRLHRVWKTHGEDVC
jgi:hypothetical protein